MLYKKIHRQFLRQWRLGRRFKLSSCGDVHEVVGKLYIDYNWHSIWLGGWCLINMLEEDSGRFWLDVEWLD